ncbi:MAG: CstA-like transporter-associated (seleno)protein [Candidatus Methylumidiphilus sp.]
MRFFEFIKTCWRGLREVSGDDAYERYLTHWQAHHAHQGGEPMDPETFFKQEMERKWSGVKRCC